MKKLANVAKVTGFRKAAEKLFSGLFRGTGGDEESRISRVLRPRFRSYVAAGLAVLLAACLTGCSRRGLPGSNRPIYKLSNDFEPLRDQFNRDADKVRVLLLLDPT